MTPSNAVEQAGWIGPRLHPFAQDVGAVVPPGFAAYARILHPAWTRWDPKAREVRWSEVAEWSGKIIHAEVQFHSIQPVPGREVPPSPWDGEPRLGTLSSAQATALAELLAGRTTAREACWFCLWEGYGYLTGASSSQTAWKEASPSQRPRRQPRWHLRLPHPRPIGNLPDRRRVRLPNRDYLLFRGPLSKGEGWEDGPNLWWPDDHAWCVASEIDLPCTYVGGPQELIDAVVGHPAIEALPATLAEGITESSDTVNG